MIAAVLGRSAGTISRELRRNSLKTKAWAGGYAPVRAQALARRRRQGGRPHKLTACPELRATSKTLSARMRRHLPRKTDSATLSPEELEAYVQRYNNTPRKRLRFLTPNEAFTYGAPSVALQT